eukprot:SAG11_NODE_4163_length_2030_cov_1.321595_3_plen_82_part_00
MVGLTGTTDRNCQVIGLLSISYMVGTVSSNIVSKKLHPQAQETKRKMTMIKEYLINKGFDAPTRRTVCCTGIHMARTGIQP